MSGRPDDAPTGPVAWGVVAAGWAVIGVAIVGALRDPRLGSDLSWLTWFFGAAVLHDAVVLPVVLGTGWLLDRSVPARWRTAVRVVLVTGGVLTVAVWPTLRRYGAQADNPSLLPLEVGRNLVALVALVALAAVVVVVAGRLGVRARAGIDRDGTR